MPNRADRRLRNRTIRENFFYHIIFTYFEYFLSFTYIFCISDYQQSFTEFFPGALRGALQRDGAWLQRDRERPTGPQALQEGREDAVPRGAGVDF